MLLCIFNQVDFNAIKVHCQFDTIFVIDFDDRVRYAMEIKKTRVKVCVHMTCCSRGSEKIYEKLLNDPSSDIMLEKTEECFRFCKIGPNVAVNGNVLHNMDTGSASNRVRKEIQFPSKKVDGIGMRSLDELDDVLRDLGI